MAPLPMVVRGHSIMFGLCLLDILPKPARPECRFLAMYRRMPLGTGLITIDLNLPCMLISMHTSINS